MRIWAAEHRSRGYKQGPQSSCGHPALSVRFETTIQVDLVIRVAFDLAPVRVRARTWPGRTRTDTAAQFREVPYLKTKVSLSTFDSNFLLETIKID